MLPIGDRDQIYITHIKNICSKGSVYTLGGLLCDQPNILAPQDSAVL